MGLTEHNAVLIALALWFAVSWYLNGRLALVHKRLDQIDQQFEGLRQYLYEIDPQFDDERGSSERLNDVLERDVFSFAGLHDMELLQRKKAEGRRTLNTIFLDGII